MDRDEQIQDLLDIFNLCGPINFDIVVEAIFPGLSPREYHDLCRFMMKEGLIERLEGSPTLSRITQKGIEILQSGGWVHESGR